MKFAQLRKLTIGIAFILLLCTGVVAEIPGKTLLIVAHPDDEYYFAATVYRIAVELGGTVDELVITNGEGGFRYSTLAEPYYGKALTDEAVGRKELPAIGRQETLTSGRILGIRNHYYLDQKGEKFTTDINEGLNRLWDSNFITSTIADLIRGEHYQYVFTVLPRSTTHGHHQAATVLATRAIRSLPEDLRPRAPILLWLRPCVCPHIGLQPINTPALFSHAQCADGPEAAVCQSRRHHTVHP